MKKRILSFALAFLFCFGSIGMLAVADEHTHVHAAGVQPVMVSRTDTSITYAKPAASHYISVTDNSGYSQNSQAANDKVSITDTTVVFSGMNPGTTYEAFLTEIATGNSGDALSTTTLLSVGAPAAPTLSSVSSTAISVSASFAGAEYYISTETTTPDDSAVWLTSNSFTGLTPATTYYVYQRVAAQGDHAVSPASAALTVTTVAKPDSITLDSLTESSGVYKLTVSNSNGYEYKMGTSGTYSTTSEYTVSLGATVSLYARVPAKAENKALAGDEITKTVVLPSMSASTATYSDKKLTVDISVIPGSFNLTNIKADLKVASGTTVENTNSFTINDILVSTPSATIRLEYTLGMANPKPTITYSVTLSATVKESDNTLATDLPLLVVNDASISSSSPTHTHTFNTAVWEKDASGHWHAATCGHTSEKGSFADHNDGNSDGLCDVCGYSMSHTHSLTHFERQEPTATATGHIEYWYCAGCGKYFSNSSATTAITQASTILSPTGHVHSLSHYNRHEPTATEDGNIEYWYCSGCGKYFSNSTATAEITSAQTVLAATNVCVHSLQHYSRQEATATTDGYREYWYCTKCHKYFTNNSATVETTLDALKISAHEHFMVSGACLICGYTGTHSHSYTSRTESLSYLKSAATCTEAAVYYYSCSVCGAIGTDTFKSSAGPLGHNFVNGICTRCSAAEGTIGGISHKNFDPKTTRCSCGALNWNKGYFEISPCSVEAKTTGAACTYTCQTCNKTIAVTWEPSECTGTHHYGERTQLPSYAWVEVCEYCGDVRVCEDQSCSHNPLLDWKLVTPNVDCTVAGEWAYECKVCHSINKVNHKVSEHTWDTGVVTTPATDTTAGVKTYTCLICQKTKTESIAPTAHVHSYGSWIAEVPATCSAEGVKGHYTCSCGMNFDESKNVIASLTIAKLSHSFGAVTTVASTCTAAGYEEKTCTACGYVSHVTLPLARHTEKVTNTPATCIADGSDVVTCTVCGQVLETRTVPATGVHSFSSDGDNAKKCVVCGFRYETKVSKGTVYMTFVENGATLTVPSTAADRLTYEAAKKGVADYASWLKVLSDAKAISGSAELCAAYDVALKNNNAEMPYSADMTVELTIPEEYKKNTVKVFASTANGLIAVESVDRNGDKVSFNANAKYTGEFLVVSDSAAKTSNPVVPIVIGIVVVLTIAGVGGYFLYKKGFFTV